jgi:hypothetical protein
MTKTLALAAATIVALSAAPSDAAHFQPAGAQSASAADAYPIAWVLEPGTRGDVIDT